MRRVAFATVALLAASLTACGGSSDTAGSDTTAGSSDTSAVQAPTSDTSSSDAPSTSGGDSTGAVGSAYCTELKTAKAEFKTIDFQHLSEDQFQKLRDEFDTLGQAAPPDVQDDWSGLTSSLDHVRQILADAGLTFDDLQALSSGQVPQGVTVTQLQKLGKQLQQFSADTTFADAAKNITQNAKTVCGLKN